MNEYLQLWLVSMCVTFGFLGLLGLALKYESHALMKLEEREVLKRLRLCKLPTNKSGFCYGISPKYVRTNVRAVERLIRKNKIAEVMVDDRLHLTIV